MCDAHVEVQKRDISAIGKCRLANPLASKRSHGRSASRPSIGCQRNNLRNTACCRALSLTYPFVQAQGYAIHKAAQNILFCGQARMVGRQAALP